MLEATSESSTAWPIDLSGCQGGDFQKTLSVWDLTRYEAQRDCLEGLRETCTMPCHGNSDAEKVTARSRRNSWQIRIWDALVTSAEWPMFSRANKHIWAQDCSGPWDYLEYGSLLIQCLHYFNCWDNCPGQRARYECDCSVCYQNRNVAWSVW